jgi:hypothetical protein
MVRQLGIEREAALGVFRELLDELAEDSANPEETSS